jgi:hypothetical protein
MHRELDILAPKNLAYGLLLAVAAFPAALLLAVLGQAIGGLLGGCSVIGISTPMDRQVWALVNQPSLHFSSQWSALGYWSGSLVLPMVVAFGAIGLLPRSRRLGSELAILHAAWAAALVGLAWLPLIDPADGHLSRWFELWRWPAALVWLAPVLALPAAMLPALRLLSLLRIVRRDSGRIGRVTAVALHLVVPASIWFTAATMIGGDPPWWSAGAAGAASLTALGVAWKGYPSPFAHRLDGLDTGSWIRVVVGATLLLALVVAAGRPLSDGHRAGLTWSEPEAMNNVRPWIEPVRLPPSGH